MVCRYHESWTGRASRVSDIARPIKSEAPARSCQTGRGASVYCMIHSRSRKVLALLPAHLLAAAVAPHPGASKSVSYDVLPSSSFEVRTETEGLLGALAQRAGEWIVGVCFLCLAQLLGESGRGGQENDSRQCRNDDSLHFSTSRNRVHLPPPATMAILTSFRSMMRSLLTNRSYVNGA